MRLMHCGKEVYVAGEAVTPSVQKGDVLFVILESGSSIQQNGLVKNTANLGIHVALVTTSAAKLKEDWCCSGLVLPAATKKRAAGEPETIQPLGSQFDQAAHLVLDAAIVEGPYTGRSNEALKKQHTNLE